MYREVGEGVGGGWKMIHECKKKRKLRPSLKDYFFFFDTDSAQHLFLGELCHHHRHRTPLGCNSSHFAVRMIVFLLIFFFFFTACLTYWLYWFLFWLFIFLFGYLLFYFAFQVHFGWPVGLVLFKTKRSWGYYFY